MTKNTLTALPVLFLGILGLAACSASDPIVQKEIGTTQSRSDISPDPGGSSINIHFQKPPEEPAGIDSIESQAISSFIQANIPWSQLSLQINGPGAIEYLHPGQHPSINAQRMAELVRLCQINGASPERIHVRQNAKWTIETTQ